MQGAREIDASTSIEFYTLPDVTIASEACCGLADEVTQRQDDSAEMWVLNLLRCLEQP